MKTYKDILEKDEWFDKEDIKKLKIGDKIFYKNKSKGQKKSGIISKIKGDSWVYINNGATAVDPYDILK